MKKKSLMASLWRLAIAAAVSIVLLVLIANVIGQPVDAALRTYHAAFTDVSGLHEGADVRVRGVRAGKVEELRLERSNGRSFADVTFTMDRRFGVVPSSHVAIKYQALTGLRYVDIAGAAENVDQSAAMTTIPTTMTQPSFDITVLFNGLQPVLAALSPDDINTFADNVATFLAGDGEGLGPMLDSIHKLAGLVSDREQVIDTIARNLTVLAQGVQGRSAEFIQVVELIKTPVGAGLAAIDEFRKSQIFGPEFANQVLRLLDAVGIKDGINIDTALDKAVTNAYDFLDSFKRIPVIWENIGPPPPVNGTPAPCSKGRAELPLPVDVLLNGRKVVLCNS